MKDRMLPSRIGPPMPWPSGPNRSGIFSTPAAKITGVDSRNANRTASSRDRPRLMPATIVTPSRLIPANRAKYVARADDEAPAVAHGRQPPVGGDRRRLLGLAHPTAAGRPRPGVGRPRARRRSPPLDA